MKKITALLLIVAMLASLLPMAFATDTLAEENIVKYIGSDGEERTYIPSQEEIAEQEVAAPMALRASASSAKATIERYPNSIIPTYTSVTGRALNDVEYNAGDCTVYVYDYYEDELNEYLDFVVDEDGWEFYTELGSNSEGYITRSYLKTDRTADELHVLNVIHTFHYGYHSVRILIEDNSGYVEDDSEIYYYDASVVPDYTSVTGRENDYFVTDTEIPETAYYYYYDEDEFNEYIDVLGCEGWDLVDDYIVTDDENPNGDYWVVRNFEKEVGGTTVILTVTHMVSENDDDIVEITVYEGGAWGDDDYPSYEDDGIHFDVTSRTMIEGNHFYIPVIIYDDADFENITWSSSNKTVATVDDEGYVTAKKAGSATITGKLPNGKKATCEITVKKFVLDYYDGTKIPSFTCVTGIEPYDSKYEDGKTYYYYNLDIDSHYDYSLYLEYKDGWEYVSGDYYEDIGCSEDKLKKGKSEITSILNYDEEYTCIVFEYKEEVKPVPVKTIKLATTKVTAYVGNELDLGSTLTVAPVDHTDEITWTSSNTNVATVDEYGIVTPLATGTAKITVKAGSKSATCTVTVVKAPEGIVVTGTTTLAKGKTSKLTAYAYYMENGKEKKTKDVISWRSEDPSIATVSKGSVKGISAGTTNIIAYIEGSDIEEVIEVTVAVPITSIKFASTKATLYTGNEFDLGAGLTFAPIENNDNIVWKSSNENVATVDEYGVVTPVATGTAKITATAEAGKKTATCTITVAKAPEGIVVTGATTVAKGKTSKLTAYAYYMENGKEKKTKDVISWRSENTSIATVSKGSVKGIGAGTTNIIAYIEGSDIEEVIEVTVAVPITSIKFASTKATLYAGNEFDLGAGLTFAPVENNDNIVWKSSNTNVATVDENGVVTPLATGTAKITATAEAGKKTASCSITVSKAPEGIVVTGNNALAKGKSVTLKAYAYYMENGKEKKTKDTISWRSEDPSIVTVSKGKIKGISAGITNIIAYIEGTDIEEVFEVSVVIPAKTVKLSIKKLTASIGDEIDLNEYLTVTPEDNSDNITWTTSKATVATVEDGIVTIVGKGSAKITAKAVAGGKSASVTITVK